MLSRIDIQDIVKIAKDAGRAVMQVYDNDSNVRNKLDGSPLTIADERSNKIIEKGLKDLQTRFPILSEEGRKVCYKERESWRYFWLIDPLDGTKEFIKKNGEFTVNIALINKNIPVLGVVYAPYTDTCYWAKQGEGAFKDGQKLPLKSIKSKGVCRIVSSRSHMSSDTQLFIDSVNVDTKEIVCIGSSLKVCLVAEGEADIYPRLGPTMEWDTGAAHAIINEAGMFFYKYQKKTFSEFFYNKRNILNSWFVVSNRELTHNMLEGGR